MRVYIDPKVQKCLQIMSRAGHKADLAARKAETVLSQLQQGVSISEEIATATRHGERRLKGCLKYDLGSGYRLVTLKRGCNLFVLYCGTHDNCHRWIENNRELRPEHLVRRCECVSVANSPGAGDAPEVSAPIETEVSEMEVQIEDDLLREIFCGLVGGPGQ